MPISALISGNATDVNVRLTVTPHRTDTAVRHVGLVFGGSTTSASGRVARLARRRPRLVQQQRRRPPSGVSALRMRHWCDGADGVTYGWKYHNFRDFGVQTIHDNGYRLNTSFVKHPDNRCERWCPLTRPMSAGRRQPIANYLPFHTTS